MGSCALKTATSLPGVLRAEGVIALVYPERELVPPPVRAFVDWMVARAPSLLPSNALHGRDRLVTEPRARRRMV
jgi:hypothetical protein